MYREKAQLIKGPFHHHNANKGAMQYAAQTHGLMGLEAVQSRRIWSHGNTLSGLGIRDANGMNLHVKPPPCLVTSKYLSGHGSKAANGMNLHVQALPNRVIWMFLFGVDLMAVHGMSERVLLLLVVVT